MNVQASLRQQFQLRFRGWLAPLAGVLVSLGVAPAVFAHGSAENPPSRTYMCRFLDTSNPMCEQAWAAEPQALYDWMEVNLGDVAGRHQEWIPDGELCGAGRAKYAAFDVPGDWPVTSMVPGSDGLYEVQFFATAPHAPQYFRFYLSREGFDPLTDRLTWDDLELVYDSGAFAYEELVADPHYSFRIPLPERDGRAILYMVWQRSDSPEAFYGCSDIAIGGAATADPGGPDVSVEPVPEVEPAPADDPVAPAPGLDGISVEVALVDDWGSGACGDGLVTNNANESRVWEVYVDLPGTVTTFWDAEISLSTHPQSEGSAISQSWRVVGASWNQALAPGASTTFGFCLDRTATPASPAEPGETPVADTAVPEPEVEEPVVETPVVEEPVAEEPVADDPVADAPDETVPGSQEPVVDPTLPGEPDVVPGTGPVAAFGSGGPVLAAYYPEWGIYARNYRISDVPAGSLTHLIYAFADLDANGDVTLFDPWAAVEVLFNADQSVSGVADVASTGPDDPRGNFGQLADLKERYPHLRVYIAVGGWTLSAHFSDVLSTEQGRDHASDSLVAFLGRYTMFDGVDFDWEYPGGGGLGGNSASSQDGENYALFMQAVREKLDTLGEANGRRYGISIASPGGSDKIANFNLAGLTPWVDFFNVMTYDFHGTWENVTGHQAALEGDPAGYDISTAIDLYLEAGVPPEKIVLGAPLYTRAWQGVADGGDGGYAEAASGAAPGSFWDQPGMYDYKDLLARVQAPGSSWKLYWDDNAQAAYLYDSAGSVFSSFETPGTVAFKSQWAQSRDLAGVMFWDLSSDDTGGGESLVTAAADFWYRGLSFDEIVAASGLEFFQVVGGNGRFDLDGTAPSSPEDPVSPGAEEAPSAGETAPSDPGDVADPDESETPPVSEEPEATPDTSGSVSVAVGGQRWWGGFTASLTVSNTTGAVIEGWSFRFQSSHRIAGEPWGAAIESVDLGNGFYEHRVSGVGWSARIPVGGSVNVGFNGNQGAAIGNEGALTEAQLFDGGFFAD